MKATRAQLDKALAAPANVRLFLFHGPDDAGSRALAKRLAAAAGADAERIDLAGSDLKSDPARLADEAASISMFGGAALCAGRSRRRRVRRGGGGLAVRPGRRQSGRRWSRATSSPSSALLKLVIASPAAIAFASYLPDARDWDRMVVELARAHGLQARPDVAQRIADAAGGNRALIEQELDQVRALSRRRAGAAGGDRS